MGSINIKYEGTNESHEMESLPKQRGEGSVTASDTLDSGEAAPRDADTLGGTITAETINTLTENLGMPIRVQDGKPQWKDTNTDIWKNFKSAPTLLGTYSGNKTIDVSSVIGADDTVDNFIVELVGIPNATGTEPGWENKWTTVIVGKNISKSLDNNILSITGATITSNYCVGTEATNYFPWAFNINYKVWHV